MLNRRELAQGLAAMGVCAVAGTRSARAQAAYPSKPINMVVGFAAGSATDIVARVVAQKLGERLGVPVTVTNVTGAGSMIAAETVVRAPADGYTLLTVSSAITIGPAVYKQLKFDVERDLVPIAEVGSIRWC